MSHISTQKFWIHHRNRRVTTPSRRAKSTTTTCISLISNSYHGLLRLALSTSQEQQCHHRPTIPPLLFAHSHILFSQPEIEQAPTPASNFSQRRTQDDRQNPCPLSCLGTPINSHLRDDQSAAAPQSWRAMAGPGPGSSFHGSRETPSQGPKLGAHGGIKHRGSFLGSCHPDCIHRIRASPLRHPLAHSHPIHTSLTPSCQRKP
ncbi:hypothetical protein B0T10DRAFT_36146 [Thelonectria olida]|uniref:Uncharacterized protein n=1 Tax=Thelonectria olida TaxID=1576542 RepID=A0A9P9AXF5_9HYPO|nr:hypothetical protein B0T10DRAFT_36146 [Thelonectria olida]